MTNLFRRLALFASVFLSLAFLLTGCLPNSQKLKIDSDGVSAELNVRVGDVLPMLKIPIKEGYSFVGWKQNGEFADVEAPLVSIEPLAAEYVKNTEKSEGLTFRRVENGLAVTGIETVGEIESLILPAYCEGFDGESEPLPIVSVAENAFRNRVIRSVVFPDTLKEIGAGAFAYSEISHPYLPSSLLKIETEAFRGVSGFRYFDVPEAVTAIASDAFLEMKNVAFRSFGKKYVADEGVLFESAKLTAYPAGAAPREYKIPDYVTEIGEYAFYRQTFGKLSFGEKLRSVAPHALEDASVSELDLQNVEILEASSLKGLTTVQLLLPRTLKLCGDRALDAVSARRVVFRGQASFRNAGRPDAALYASDDCIETVRKFYPAATVFSESRLFGKEPMVENGKIVDCPDQAEAVVVDASVTEIAPFAFRGEALRSVTFLGAPPVFGVGAFRRLPNLKLYVPVKLLDAYREACPEYAEYFFGKDASEEETAVARVAFFVEGNAEYRTVNVGENLTLPTASSEGKRFIGWRAGGTLFAGGEAVAITGDTDFTAVFEKSAFTVTFYANGTPLKTQTVSYLGGASAPIAPEKPSSAEFDYSFDGWDKMFDCVTEDLEVNAVYREIPRRYTVEFYAENRLLKTDSVRYRQAATAPDNPQKEPTAANVYRFDGWDKPFSEITESVKIYARFTELTRFYTVTYRADGAEIKTERVEYGQRGTPPELPEKPSSPQHDFVFLGWDRDVSRVESDLTVNARYREVARNYAVKFFADGILLAERSVPYGGSAIAPQNPEKEATAAAEYRFIGWDKAFDSITENIDISALFETFPREYTVRFFADKTLRKEERVRYGGSAIAPQNPEKEQTAAAEYRFIGWDKAFDSITEDTDVSALFETFPREYTVRFFADKTLLKEERVRYGGSAIAPQNPEKETTAAAEYRFIGWDKAFDSITENIDISALFETFPREYKVRFFADKTLLKEERVRYGGSAIAPQNPEKEPTAAAEYRFIGWDRSFDSITENMDISALFEEFPRAYLVRFFADGIPIKTETVRFGESAEAPAPPEKQATAETVYAFVGWDKEFSAVTESIDVFAVFRAERRTYTVTIKTDAGETACEKTVPYGAEIGALPKEWNGRGIAKFLTSDGVEVGETTVITSGGVWKIVFEQDDYDPYAYTEGLEFYYDYDLNAYFVSAYYGHGADIVVPERYLGYEGDCPVVKIGRGVFEYCRIDSLKLPETLLVIDGSAFFQATGIENVVLPRSLREIGCNAFYSDFGITVTVTGDALTEIATQDNPLVIAADGELYERFAERFGDRWDVEVVPTAKKQA